MRRGSITVPYLEPHRFPERGSQFLADPGCHCPGSNAPGLGVADKTMKPPPDTQAQLGYLGSLPGTGLATDDNHLISIDRSSEFIKLSVYRELTGK